MATPADIRAVPRPVNTIVDDSGRNGPKRYAVRERASTRYVPGGNPQPRNGRVIGHIINYKFVPSAPAKKSKYTTPASLSYGTPAIVYSVTRDIEKDLLAVYDPDDVSAIMSIATIRILRPTITTDAMSEYYSRSFICRYYPEISLTDDSVNSLFDKLGTDDSRRRLFYRKRILSTDDGHHIAIGTTLRRRSGKSGDLYDFSFIADLISSGDISIIYAYDIELMEPVCADFLPCTRIDANSYIEFIQKNDIHGVVNPGKKEYNSSNSRDVLNLVFNKYKNNGHLKHPSSAGSEFINFISAVAACRIIKKAQHSGLLDKMTYGDLIADLSSAERRIDAPDTPYSDDSYWVSTPASVIRELEALGLSHPRPTPPLRKRSRPENKS